MNFTVVGVTSDSWHLIWVARVFLFCQTSFVWLYECHHILGCALYGMIICDHLSSISCSCIWLDFDYG